MSDDLIEIRWFKVIVEEHSEVFVGKLPNDVFAALPGIEKKVGHRPEKTAVTERRIFAMYRESNLYELERNRKRGKGGRLGLTIPRRRPALANKKPSKVAPIGKHNGHDVAIETHDVGGIAVNPAALNDDASPGG
jgi:hypothetical protein